MRTNPYRKGNAMEWSETVLYIFLTICTVFLAIALVALQIIKKIVNFLFMPFTSRSNRK